MLYHYKNTIIRKKSWHLELIKIVNDITLLTYLLFKDMINFAVYFSAHFYIIQGIFLHLKIVKVSINRNIYTQIITINSVCNSGI